MSFEKKQLKMIGLATLDLCTDLSTIELFFLLKAAINLHEIAFHYNSPVKTNTKSIQSKQLIKLIHRVSK